MPEFYISKFSSPYNFIGKKIRYSISSMPWLLFWFRESNNRLCRQAWRFHSKLQINDLEANYTGFLSETQENKSGTAVSVFFCKPICQHEKILILRVIQSITGFDFLFLHRACITLRVYVMILQHYHSLLTSGDVLTFSTWLPAFFLQLVLLSFLWLLCWGWFRLQFDWLYGLAAQDTGGRLLGLESQLWLL